MAAKNANEIERKIQKNDLSRDVSNTVATELNAPKIHSDPMSWVHEQIENDASPRDIIHHLVPRLNLPDQVDDLSLWRLVFEIITEPEPRERLLHVTSIEHVVKLITNCKNIIVLTGAGVSVSCGIPDFRSRDGIYARLSKDYPDLPDPQSMFDIHYFRSNPWPFFKFAKEIYPGQFVPSLCHRFISHLDKSGKLLRNYTQNIDTLEQTAGIKNVVQCHGSFATATCTNCKHKVNSDEIRKDIFEERIPYCTQCQVKSEEKSNILKPDIVFFGESLPQTFHERIQEDKEKADLLIVIGSSLKVRPVALIPSLVKPDVPQILINREPISLQFDVEFYGNCDDVICELCEQLGGEWQNVIGSFQPKPLDEEKMKNMFNEAENTTNNLEFNNVTEESMNEDVKSLEMDCESCAGDKNDENIRRRCGCGDQLPVTKKRKPNDVMQSKQDVFYLSVPPNRYIFYGAEFDSADDFDSDYENDVEEGDSGKFDIVEHGDELTSTGKSEMNDRSTEGEKKFLNEVNRNISA